MTETNIQLLFFGDSQTWTVIVDGKPHRNLTSVAAEELVEYTMVSTEQAHDTSFAFDEDEAHPSEDQLAFRLPN